MQNNMSQLETMSPSPIQAPENNTELFPLTPLAPEVQTTPDAVQALVNQELTALRALMDPTLSQAELMVATQNLLRTGPMASAYQHQRGAGMMITEPLSGKGKKTAVENFMLGKADKDKGKDKPIGETGLQGEAKFMAEYLEKVKPDDIKFVAGETRKRVIVSEQTQAAGDVLAVPNIGEKRRLSSETLPSSSGEIRPVLSTPESRRVVGEGVAQSQGEVQRVDAVPSVRVFTAESIPEGAGEIHPTFGSSNPRTIVGESLEKTTGTIKDFSLPAASSNVVRSAPLENRGEVNPQLQTSGANVIESAPIEERTEDRIDVRFGVPRKQKVESGLPTRDKDGEILSVSHDRVGQKVVAEPTKPEIGVVKFVDVAPNRKVVAGESLAAEPQRDLIPHFAPPRTRRVTAAPVRVMEPVQIAKSTEDEEEKGKEKPEKVVAQMPEEPGVIKYVQNLSGNTITGEEVDDVAPGEIRAIPVKDRYAKIAARAVLPRSRTDDGLELPPLGRSEKTQTVTGEGLTKKQSIVFPQMQPARGSRRVTRKSVLQ